MSIEELIEKEAQQYKERYTGKRATINSEQGYRNSSYGSAAITRCGMNIIMAAYREYKTTMEW